MWAQVVFWIVSLIISYATRSKPEKPKPGQIDVATAEEGRPIPVLFGTKTIKGANVIWYGDIKTSPVKSKSGKK